MGRSMTTAKYTKLQLKGGKSLITLYAGKRVHDSWKAVSQKFDLFEGVTDLFNVLEAAVEQGKRLGRAEVMSEVKNLEKALGKQINAIEKAIPYKAPGRPKKKPPVK
jgi:hypothetical protein